VGVMTYLALLVGEGAHFSASSTRIYASVCVYRGSALERLENSVMLLSIFRRRGSVARVLILIFVGAAARSVPWDIECQDMVDLDLVLCIKSLFASHLRCSDRDFLRCGSVSP